jgi:hypothetical protein
MGTVSTFNEPRSSLFAFTATKLAPPRTVDSDQTWPHRNDSKSIDCTICCQNLRCCFPERLDGTQLATVSVPMLRMPPPKVVAAGAATLGIAVCDGQSGANPLPTLRLFPAVGTGKVSGALPMFCTVAKRGPSLLWEPTFVRAKLKLGSVVKFGSHAAFSLTVK